MLYTIYRAGCDASDSGRRCDVMSDESWAMSLAKARKELEKAGWTFTNRGKIGNSHLHLGWAARCPNHKLADERTQS